MKNKTFFKSRIIGVRVNSNITPPVSSDELQKLAPYAVTFRYDDREIELSNRTKEPIWNSKKRRYFLMTIALFQAFGLLWMTRF